MEGGEREAGEGDPFAAFWEQPNCIDFLNSGSMIVTVCELKSVTSKFPFLSKTIPRG